MREMTRRAATLAIAVAMALGAPALGVLDGTVAPACAATQQRAALVVDTGTQARSYCVALGAAAVSGTDLIRLAHAQYGLDYRLGYGGRAVCRLDGVGVDGGDCFADFPDYWGYWHGDGSGGWTWASASAADWTVHPGDVEGWQWGTGEDATTHAMPPGTTEEDVCPPLEPSPTASPVGGGGGGGHGGGSPDASDSPGAAGPPTPPATVTPTADRAPRDRVRGEATPTPTPSSTGAPPVSLAAAQGPGPPPADAGGAGPLLALAAVIGLGVAGSIVIRRRTAAS